MILTAARKEAIAGYFFILPTMLGDNVKTREMQSDGSYRRVVRPANTPPLRAQIRLLAGLPLDDVYEGDVEK